MGAKVRALGNAIGNATQNAYIHLMINPDSIPVLSAVNTPDITKAIKKDMPSANRILVLSVGI